MSRLTRDGTAEPVSRDQILRHARGQGNVHFPCSADHEQDWQPYPVDPYSAICDDHTYIHTYIHTLEGGSLFITGRDLCMIITSSGSTSSATVQRSWTANLTRFSSQMLPCGASRPPTTFRTVGIGRLANERNAYIRDVYFVIRTALT